MNQMFSAGALICALASVFTFSMRPGLYLSQELVIRSAYPGDQNLDDVECWVSVKNHLDSETSILTAFPIDVRCVGFDGFPLKVQPGDSAAFKVTFRVPREVRTGQVPFELCTRTSKIPFALELGKGTYRANLTLAESRLHEIPSPMQSNHAEQQSPELAPSILEREQE